MMDPSCGDLLACLRAALNREPLSTTYRPDWNNVWRDGTKHGLIPLLYPFVAGLKQSNRPPKPMMAAWRFVYLQSAARNLKLYDQLREILEALHGARIPVIVLKGACLAEHVYKNIALRPMADIDLLVRKDDLGHAMDTLMRSGYRQHMQLRLEASEIIGQHLPPLVRPGGVKVELHWTLTCRSKIELDQIWQRARTISNGVVMAQEDLLLHLCEHLAHRHTFETGLRPLCDVASLVRNSGDHGLDWDLLCGTAMQRRVVRSTYFTLFLARELIGARVPDDVLTTLEPPRMDTSLMEWARQQALNPSDLACTANLARAWQAKRWQDRVRAFIVSAFPDRRILASMYPVSARSGRIYLYYLMRIKDLFLRHGPTVWNILLRNPGALDRLQRNDRTNRLRDWLGSE